MKSDGSKFKPLDHARKQVIQQLMPYICNTTLLGSDDAIDRDQVVYDLHYAKKTRDVKYWIPILTLYNEAGTGLGINEDGLGFTPGPANPQHPWDDPMDETD